MKDISESIKKAQESISKGISCPECGANGFHWKSHMNPRGEVSPSEKKECRNCGGTGFVKMSKETIALALYLKGIDDKLNFILGVMLRK